MEKRPLFSIITICYNSSKTIKETFESLLNQSCQDYEYLIIDGKSSDGTLEIIKEYEQKFQGRMNWQSEKDRGLYDAMNKGVLKAKGKIIGIINSDDWYEVDALEKVKNIYQNEVAEAKFLICGRLKNQFLAKNKPFEISDLNKDLEKYFPRYMPIRHPSAFISKSTYDLVGLYDLKYKIAADYEFVYRCYNQQIKFYLTDEILANFREGGVSGFKNAYQVALENLKIQFRHSRHKAISSLVFLRRIEIILKTKFLNIFKR